MSPSKEYANRYVLFSFLRDLDRILQADYLPSHVDVLKSPATTHGLREHFIQDSKPTWRVHEVVGEAVDQCFWSNLPRNMTALIMITDVSLYIPTLLESHELPDRLHQDLEFFGRICSLQQYSQVPVALVFDRVDVLGAGFANTSIPSLFVRDLQKANCERLLAMFNREFSLRCCSQRQLYTHFATGGNNKTIGQFVQSVVNLSIAQSMLKDSLPLLEMPVII